MKLRKILAGAMAAAVAVSAMAVSASAFADSYTATLGFADDSWAAQDWATTCEITGDGTYSITSNCLFDVIDEDTGEEVKEPAAGAGIKVMVVDIAKLGADLGINVAPEDAAADDDSWKYATGDVKVTDVKLTSGDKEFAIDQSKIKVGDTESKGNLRIEIYNSFGPTTVSEAYDASVSPLDPSTFGFLAEDQFTITFTISGLNGEAAADEAVDAADDVAADEANEAVTLPATDEETPAADEAPAAGEVDAATDSAKGSPDTGVADVAAVAGLAIVAAGAVLVSKKRK